MGRSSERERRVPRLLPRTVPRDRRGTRDIAAASSGARRGRVGSAVRRRETPRRPQVVAWTDVSYFLLFGIGSFYESRSRLRSPADRGIQACWRLTLLEFERIVHRESPALTAPTKPIDLRNLTPR